MIFCNFVIVGWILFNFSTKRFPVRLRPRNCRLEALTIKILFRMKNLKLFLTLFVFLLSASAAFSQKVDFQAKAAEKATQINNEIVSVNPKAALTADQTAKIVEIEAKKLTDQQALRKSGLSKEELAEKQKALNQEAGKKISELLTDDQRKARKNAKKAEKS